MAKTVPRSLQTHRLGIARWQDQYRHGPLQLDTVNHQHPIMRNIDRLDLYDESYWNLSGEPETIEVLATSTEDTM